MEQGNQMEVEANKGLEHDPARQPRQPQHPLLIQDILGHVLKFVENTNDLRNCRLVNSMWNLETCKVLHKRLTVTFLDQISISTYLNSFDADDAAFPHTTFQFYHIEFNSNNKLLGRFFFEFGSRIKSLKLQLPHISFEYLHNILRLHLPNLQSIYLRTLPKADPEKRLRASGSLRTFPNVQVLTLGAKEFALPITVGSGAWNEQICNPLLAVLALFPNLTKISLSKLDNPCNTAVCTKLMAGIVSHAPNRLKYLSSLDFPVEADEQLILDLTTLNCPYLNNLDLTLTSLLQAQTITNFLNMIGPNLTEFKLSFPKSYTFSFQHGILLGQALRNVKELTLTRYRWKMEFLINMQQLEKLVLKETNVSYVFPNNMNKEINLSVLRIEPSVDDSGSQALTEVPVLNSITGAFPWLKVLQIPGVSDSGLRVIYFNLPCLITLECVKGEFTDFGITGVSLEICRDLAETTTYLVVNADKLRTDLFIGNLTNLRTLRLESETLGNLSILFGVCKCLKLENLYLTSPMISDVAIEAIADHLGDSLRSLNVLHCPEVTEAGKFYIKESVPVCGILVESEPNPDNEQREDRQTASRFHRFCDAYQRRKLAGERINDSFEAILGNVCLGPGIGDLRRAQRRFRYGMPNQHRNILPNPLQPPIPYNAGAGLLGEQIGIGQFNVEAHNLQGVVDEEDDEYVGAADAGGGMDNIPQGIFNQLQLDHDHFDQIMDDI